jgi:hypothetical protein
MPEKMPDPLRLNAEIKGLTSHAKGIVTNLEIKNNFTNSIDKLNPLVSSPIKTSSSLIISIQSVSGTFKIGEKLAILHKNKLGHKSTTTINSKIEDIQLISQSLLPSPSINFDEDHICIHNIKENIIIPKNSKLTSRTSTKTANISHSHWYSSARVLILFLNDINGDFQVDEVIIVEADEINIFLSISQVHINPPKLSIPTAQSISTNLLSQELTTLSQIKNKLKSISHKDLLEHIETIKKTLGLKDLSTNDAIDITFTMLHDEFDPGTEFSPTIDQLKKVHEQVVQGRKIKGRIRNSLQKAKSKKMKKTQTKSFKDTLANMVGTNGKETTTYVDFLLQNESTKLDSK